ncbi:MAG: deoxyribodipyrimidine photo-lyase, partial [Pseudomonadota bacterium]
MALVLAAATSAVLPLYVVEPELWNQPDMSARQWAFVSEALTELRFELKQLGQPLIVRVGTVSEILAEFHETERISGLWSHEETGNAWTFRRDRLVAAWCRTNAVPWHEVRNHGVQRRLKSRDGWAKNWDSFMAEPQSCPPAL